MGSDSEKMRLNKYLAACGVCSRRDADVYIDEGRVLVNGELPQKGVKVSTEDLVEVDGKKIGLSGSKTVLAYTKPVGVVCTERDAHAKRTVIEELGYHKRVTYAGRLDKDSDGLLIMTDDGDLINAMMKSIHKHEKEYVVRVDRDITEAFLNKMQKGVYLKELDVTTRSCKIKKITNDSFDIILTQGLNRQIRRMCQAFGYRVRKLIRVRVMNIELGDLAVGKYRELSDNEVAGLKKLCGLQ